MRAYHGDVTVTSNEKKVGSDLVYNLEVKDLHNFLVGDVGIVVHNSYIDELVKIYNDIIGKTGLKHIFHGEVKAGKASGVHHIRAIKDGTADHSWNKNKYRATGEWYL